VEPGVAQIGKRSDPSRTRCAPPTARRLFSLNVLVVDDDAADVSLILDVLRRNRDVSSAHAARAPETALSQIESGHLAPDLVLLDIQMPRIDGFQFLERLRRIPAMAVTPVAFLTTSRLAKDVIRAGNASGMSYIVKPDTYVELQTRLNALLRRTISVLAIRDEQHDARARSLHGGPPRNAQRA
jgi:DNA-binding response OmpR family regulator